MKLCHFSLKNIQRRIFNKLKKYIYLTVMYIGFLMRNQYKKKNQNVCYYIMHNTKELQSAVSFLILVFFFLSCKKFRSITCYEQCKSLSVVWLQEENLEKKGNYFLTKNMVNLQMYMALFLKDFASGIFWNSFIKEDGDKISTRQLRSFN